MDALMLTVYIDIGFWFGSIYYKTLMPLILKYQYIVCHFFQQVTIKKKKAFITVSFT